MLAMGLSLRASDFKACAANPVPILLGFVMQYSVLPILAFLIARMLNLSPAFATGLILLGCCPGGQVRYAGAERGGSSLQGVLPLTATCLLACGFCRCRRATWRRLWRTATSRSAC